MKSPEQAEIEALIRGVFEAFAGSKPELINLVDDPDITIWDVFTPNLIRGIEQRAKFRSDDERQKEARGSLHWDIEPDMVVDVWNDIAAARYYLNFRYDPPNPVAGRIRITDVLRRIDGRWRRVHHHEGMTPVGIPPITEEKH